MKKRQVIETSNKELIPYKRYGEKTNDLSWLPISKDNDSKYEVYLIKFDPGSSSNFHRHNGNEEFYVIDGELIDDDGKIFKTGDYKVTLFGAGSSGKTSITRSLLKNIVGQTSAKIGTTKQINSYKIRIPILKRNINIISKTGGFILLGTGILILTNQLQAVGFYLLKSLPFLQNLG